MKERDGAVDAGAQDPVKNKAAILVVVFRSVPFECETFSVFGFETVHTVPELNQGLTGTCLLEVGKKKNFLIYFISLLFLV